MNQIRQTMLSRAFKTGLYDGITTIGALKEQGRFGLGEFEALDGELIVWEGNFYRATGDGKVRVADDSDRLCFAQVSGFDPTRFLDAPKGITHSTIPAFLAETEGTRNTFFALTLEGLFETVTVTAFHRQTKPYPPYASVSPQAFTSARVVGRIVAFYSPPYMRDIGVAGYHFHFLAAGLAVGGHVTAFTVTRGTIALEEIDRFSLEIPTNDLFRQANLENS